MLENGEPKKTVLKMQTVKEKLTRVLKVSVSKKLADKCQYVAKKWGVAHNQSMSSTWTYPPAMPIISYFGYMLTY